MTHSFPTRRAAVPDPRWDGAGVRDGRPTVWLAVARVREKIKAVVEAKVAAEESPVKKRLMSWGLAMGEKNGDAALAGKPLAGLDALQFKVADKLVLAKVRAALGPDELKWAWRSEEHTSELQSLMRISYAVFCLKKKTEIKK